MVVTIETAVNYYIGNYREVKGDGGEYFPPGPIIDAIIAASDEVIESVVNSEAILLLREAAAERIPVYIGAIQRLKAREQARKLTDEQSHKPEQTVVLIGQLESLIQKFRTEHAEDPNIEKTIRAAVHAFFFQL